MRALDTVVIHYSATPPDRPVTVEEIRGWHVARGFKDCGYHFVVHQDGTVDEGRPLEQTGAHCRGHNTGSIGICYIGGLRGGSGHDTRTDAQREAIHGLIEQLRSEHGPMEVVGHRDLGSTQCPGYDAGADFARWQLERWPVPEIRPPTRRTPLPRRIVRAVQSLLPRGIA